MVDSSPPTQRRPRRWYGTLLRIVALGAIIVAAGAVTGFAVGYPLSRLDFGADDSIQLDDVSLAGRFDPIEALVRITDLPDTYADVTEENGGLPASRLIGASYCGQTPTVVGQVSNPESKFYVDLNNQSIIVSEVVRVTSPRDGDAFIREVTDALDACRNGTFFRVQDGERSEFNIKADRPPAPILQYVSRTLEPVDGGVYEVVTYFQVGDVLVALQYAGPTRPTDEFLQKLEIQILARVAPQQFSITQEVDGLEPIPPDDSTTTTTIDPAAPSPTASPDTVAPAPTEAPDPTFESPKPTTTQKGSSGG